MHLQEARHEVMQARAVELWSLDKNCDESVGEEAEMDGPPWEWNIEGFPVDYHMDEIGSPVGEVVRAT